MKKHAYALIAALGLFAAPAFGQGWNIERIGEWYDSWSDVMHVAQAGNYAYLGIENQGLSMVDLTDPTDPYEVAYLSLAVIDLAASGNLLYVGSEGKGFLIYNVSNPAVPNLLSQTFPTQNIFGVFPVGNLVYLLHAPSASIDRDLAILDVSDPADPRFLGGLDLPSWGNELEVSGSYAYICSWNADLWIVDISNPASPILVGALSDLPGNCYEVAVSDEVAYLALLTTGLFIVDVSNPANPTVIAHQTFSDWTDAVGVSGDYAYVGTIGDGLYIVDIAQPSNPVIVGNEPGPGYNSPLRDLVIVEPYVYGAWDEYHFRITDVANPQNPTSVSSYSTYWTIEDVAYQENYAYLAAGDDGLLINDVSDPAHPWQAAYLNDIGNATDIQVADDYAYLQTTQDLFRIVDIADPLHPSLVGSYPLFNGRIQRIVGDLAYATSDGVLKILSLSNPINPVEICSYSIPGYPLSGIGELDTDGRFLYAYAGFEVPNGPSYLDSLLVLDVNDPTHPLLLGLYSFTTGMWGTSADLVLGDGYLYVAMWETDGFKVFNITDPTNPFEVGSLTVAYMPHDMQVSGSFVYLTAFEEGLQIIDVSNPAQPVLTGYYDPSGGAYGLAVNGDYAYMAQSSHFGIYDCSDATHNDVNVTITPLIQPIQIPASGGSFDFYLFAANGGPGSQTVDLWTRIILPGGSVLNPILGPVSVSLDSGMTGWIRHQSVPGNAPAGLYTYIACAGDYPNSVWATDSLQFTKLGSGDWGPGAGDWENSGESFNSSDESFIAHHSSLITSIRPNPFNPTTTFGFELRAASFVKLSVFDISGRLVATLMDGWREAGMHEVAFDGAGLPSGIYIYRITAGSWSSSEKMILLK